VFAPDAVPDYAPLVALAEKASQAEPKNYSIAVTHGAVLYRAGKPAEAVRRLQEAVALHGKGGAAYDGFLLAMAHGQLKQDEAARKELARAAEWLDRNYGEAMRQEKNTPALHWHLRLEFQVL